MFQILLYSLRFYCTDLCGPEGASQAIGFLLGLCSLPLTVGPPIAGMLYDQTKSYTVSFILAGIPAIFGALIMSLIHKVKNDHNNDVIGNGVDPEAFGKISLICKIIFY